MCSVMHLVDNNIELIESKRNAIQRLYGLLVSDNEADTDRQENGYHKQPNLKRQVTVKDDEKTRQDKTSASLNYNIPKNLMLHTNGLLRFSDLDKRNQKKQQLAEERRREYNEYLQQKSKRATKGIALNDDYNELLNRKRLEERKHRQVNGLDELNGFDDLDHIESHSPEPNQGSHYKVATTGWFHCSNNKFVPEYITPRSRLLATHSSRLKAMQYREELKKQIEEKQRLKEQEKERIRLEEEELERKLEAQRMKLLAEYETEQRLIREKTKELAIKDELSKQLTNKEVLASSSPLSLLRSPTYMHMRKDRGSRQSPIKSGKASKSLASALSESARTTRTMGSQTSEEPNSSEQESQDSSEDDEPTEKMSREMEFRQRVLSQLSDVRRMMESDHIKLREELRRQMNEDSIQ